jgi:hypothetical protein
VASKAPAGRARAGRAPDPAALEYARTLVEFAEGARGEPPRAPPGLRAADLFLALRALGRDPVEVAKKARERWETLRGSFSAEAAVDEVAKWGRGVTIQVGGREVHVVNVPDDVDKDALRDYVARYMAAVPPLSFTFRNGEYLRDETPYFTVSIWEKPPIRMKPPYDVDYARFWEPYKVLKLQREERHMLRLFKYPTYWLDEDGRPQFGSGLPEYAPHYEKVAESLFLFAEGLSERDGVPVSTSLFRFVVPFDVFELWLRLEGSCVKLSPRAFARRMPPPLKGYLILYLNDEYKSIDILRTASLSLGSEFDRCYVYLDPQVYDSLAKTVERLDAVSAFVEILKTAIKHAEEFNLADISRLLNR